MHISPWSGLDKEIWESTRDFATVAKALETARSKLAAAGPGTWDRMKWADRLAYLEAQFNDVLSILQKLLGKLDPLSQIEGSLKQSAPGADVSLGKDPASGIKTYLKKVTGKDHIEQILKPTEATPRTVKKAEYMVPDGVKKDVTTIVNNLIKANQGLFIKVAAHPHDGCANNLFGDPQKGADKVFRVETHNGHEYYWSESQEVNFLVPVATADAGPYWKHGQSKIGSDWEVIRIW